MGLYAYRHNTLPLYVSRLYDFRLPDMSRFYLKYISTTAIQSTLSERTQALVELDEWTLPIIAHQYTSEH